MGPPVSLPAIGGDQSSREGLSVLSTGRAGTMMMRRSLIELLAERQIAHPTRIERATIQNACLEVVTSGYPWWRNAEQPSEEGTLVLIFDGLSDGTLSVSVTASDGSEEDLEDFAVYPLASIDWAQPQSHAIYCSGPLMDPVALYQRLEDYLYEHGAFKHVSDYLNNGYSLRAFSEMTAKMSYCLGHCPASVLEILSEELKAQHVPYTVIAHTCRPENRLWVRLNGSDFLCADAWAEIVP